MKRGLSKIPAERPKKKNYGLIDPYAYKHLSFQVTPGPTPDIQYQKIPFELGYNPVIDAIAAVVANGPQPEDFEKARLKKYSAVIDEWTTTFLWALQMSSAYEKTITQWPFSTQIFVLRKPWGADAHLELELAELVCQALTPEKTGVNGYVDLWYNCMLESYEKSFRYCDKKPPTMPETRSKIMKFSKAVKNFENPYDSGDSPAKYHLCEMVLMLHGFHKENPSDPKSAELLKKLTEVWGKYGKNARKFTQAFVTGPGYKENQFNRLVVEGNRLVAHLGGRQTKQLYPEISRKKFRSGRGLKPKK